MRISRLWWMGVLALAACGPAEQGAEWTTDATEHRAELGQQFRYLCPAGGSAAPLWGTDTYTDDSSVCTAAVHAGLITLASGGQVTLQMVEGLQSYVGSTRNGVTSSEYADWQNAFQFVE